MNDQEVYMKVEKCCFNGIADCLKLSDNGIDLWVTTAFGPRIIGAGFSGGKNFFSVFSDQIENPAKEEWNIYGGHRFWTAPEVYPRTYYPDNTPVKYTVEEDSLLLEPEEEIENSVKKQLKITMHDGEILVSHILTNISRWEIEVAAWGLSVMAPGGKLYVPQEKFVPAGKAEGHTLLPGRAMAMWPYTDMSDERFTWGKDFITMSEYGGSGKPLKFGLFNSLGYAAYELDGAFFVKHFPAYPDCVYPDFGCNCEFYTEKGMLEVESLSPLTLLAPGETIIHSEKWEFYHSAPEKIFNA